MGEACFFMLNVLVVTEHEVVYLDVTHSFYSHEFLANHILVKNWQELLKANQKFTFDVVIIDFPSKISFKNILECCKGNNTNCLVYGIFDEMDEVLISEFIHHGAASFALKSKLPSLVASIRKDLQEKKSKPFLLVTPTAKPEPSFFSSFFERAVDPIWVKDKKGKYLFINLAGAEFINKPINEIIGKYDYDVFPAETAEKISKSDSYVLQTGKTQIVEGALMNCNNVNRVFQAIKTIYRDQSGEPQGLIGTVRDVTEQKHTEVIVKDSQQRYNSLLQHVKEAAHYLTESDPNGHV